MALVAIVISVVAGFLIGGIPMGVLIADHHKVDISATGSGRTGTTNVLRTIGRRAAAVVLLGDVLKGAAAVLVGRLLVWSLVPPPEQHGLLGLSVWSATDIAATAGAMAGHVWSIYVRLLHGRWQGGRGVATALGAVVVVSPLAVVAALGVGLPTIAISRYVSLGSILGAIAGGVVLVVQVMIGAMDPLAILFLFAPIFILVSHRDNIERLLNGTERKLGHKVRT